MNNNDDPNSDPHRRMYSVETKAMKPAKIVVIASILKQYGLILLLVYTKGNKTFIIPHSIKNETKRKILKYHDIDLSEWEESSYYLSKTTSYLLIESNHIIQHG